MKERRKEGEEGKGNWEGGKEGRERGREGGRVERAREG